MMVYHPSVIIGLCAAAILTHATSDQRLPSVSPSVQNHRQESPESPEHSGAMRNTAAHIHEYSPCTLEVRGVLMDMGCFVPHGSDDKRGTSDASI